MRGILTIEVGWPWALGGKLPPLPLGYAFLTDDYGVFLTDDIGNLFIVENANG